MLASVYMPLAGQCSIDENEARARADGIPGYFARALMLQPSLAAKNHG
jgi:hypothetical protein